jgi:hypothetical protein
VDSAFATTAERLARRDGWTAHGDPAGLLLGQFAKLSAVTVADNVARREPLALHSVAAKLRARDVDVPDLPPPGEMTRTTRCYLACSGPKRLRGRLRFLGGGTHPERLAERDPEQPVPAELTRTTEDLAWFIADSFAPLTRTVDRNSTFPFDMTQLSDAGWDVSIEALFDAMSRLDHPDAEAVLIMRGKHCDDKKTAKAARKAAFKAASRRTSCRS